MPSLLQNLRNPKFSNRSSKSSSDERTDNDRSQDKEKKPKSGTMEIFQHSKDKRRSLTSTGTPRSGSPSARKASKESPKMTPMKPATLEVDMESPPIVFYGPPGQSTGALLSGQLVLTPHEPEISIKTFEMTLVAKVTTKKPVKHDCPECTYRTTELFRWKFLSEPAHFARRQYRFPFSYLLPGHIPATCHGVLGSIDYILLAEAVSNFAEPITVERILKVQRALMPNADKTSTRIFPPTNLVATVILPSVMHPIGSFRIQMRVTGVVTKLKDHTARWRIRRMHWRIDETFKTISEACKRHSAKIGGEGKGVFHEDVREIGRDEIKEGWKTDFDAEGGGSIECEFPVSLLPGAHPLCDVESPTGLGVTHNLAVELIVAEEQCSLRNPGQGIPTGSARVLRMHFKLVVTERAGLGISWDEEQPPMYDDVPISPPTYAKADPYEGDLLPEEELEGMV